MYRLNGFKWLHSVWLSLVGVIAFKNFVEFMNFIDSITNTLQITSIATGSTNPLLPRQVWHHLVRPMNAKSLHHYQDLKYGPGGLKWVGGLIASRLGGPDAMGRG